MNCFVNNTKQEKNCYHFRKRLQFSFFSTKKNCDHAIKNNVLIHRLFSEMEYRKKRSLNVHDFNYIKSTIYKISTKEYKQIQINLSSPNASERLYFLCLAVYMILNLEKLLMSDKSERFDIAWINPFLYYCHSPFLFLYMMLIWSFFLKAYIEMFTYTLYKQIYTIERYHPLAQFIIDASLVH